MASDIEELDLISVIWIIASNDENHLVTYEGIRDRLGLEKSIDVKSLVNTRRELFRPGAPPGELEEWKIAMRYGKRIPPWIKLIQDESKRSLTIENLSHDDVFRSQFRTNRGDSKSAIEIVNWGLEHIERLRKSRIAIRDASAKSWQMWLVFIVGVANIITTIFIAFNKGNENKSSLAEPVAVTATQKSEKNSKSIAK